jgi:uncharacterized protein
MKELTEFIVKRIVTEGKYEISESDQEGQTMIEIKASPDTIGLIIGKGGNTIKAIQTLLRVKGRLENKLVSVNVSEL